MSDINVPISVERLKTAKLAMRYLNAPDTRARMKDRDLLTIPIVLAEYGTRKAEVQKLVERQDDAERVLILIRKDDDSFVSIGAKRHPVTDKIPEDALRVDEIGPDIPIGQVWETLRPKQWDMSGIQFPGPSIRTHQPTLANYRLAAIV